MGLRGVHTGARRPTQSGVAATVRAQGRGEIAAEHRVTQGEVIRDLGVRALWKVAVDEGITIDLFLMQYGMIESATKMMREFPSLTYGFCHCMDLKPGPNLERDLKAVLELARFKNLHAKVDFIGTGTQRAYPCDDLHDAAMQVIRAYGPERCLWTSSYPNEIWTPKITYAEHLKIFTEALPLRDSERKLILGENARKIWFKNSAFL